MGTAAMSDGFDVLYGVLLTRLLDPPDGDDLHASLLADLRGRRGAGRRAARVWRLAVLAGEGFDQAAA
jgi:hypothetical protein